MIKHIQLRKAPLEEAIIDFRLKTEGDIDHREFAGLSSRLGRGYEEGGEIVMDQIRFDLDAGAGEGSGHSQTSLHGSRYIRKDPNFAVQLTGEGVTTSHLRPYTDWKTFRSEAKRVWETVSEIYGRHSIERVATRYINKINLTSSNKIPFNHYLKKSPSIPDGLGDVMTKFFYHIELPVSDLKSMATITQFVNNPKADGELPELILDIDVFKRNRPESNVIEIDVWNLLDQFRKYKNKVFFSTLTKKALEIFQ